MFNDFSSISFKIGAAISAVSFKSVDLILSGPDAL